jgi:hypothetical protein
MMTGRSRRRYDRRNSAAEIEATRGTGRTGNGNAVVKSVSTENIAAEA